MDIRCSECLFVMNKSDFFKRWLIFIGFVFLQNIEQVEAQDNRNFQNYLVLGVETAESLASIYLEPLSEGLLYGLTGAWNNSAQVKKPWELHVALVGNGSFVPREKLSKSIDISAIENLEVLGGQNRVEIPTILGNEESEVTFVATLNGEEFTFDAPTGIGLFSANLLPNAFLQASLGLPLNSEFSLRIFPRIEVSGAKLGTIGFGLKHELTKTIEGLKDGPFHVSIFGAFTRLDADYGFQADGFVTGESQRLDIYLNSWNVETLISTKFPIWNLYGGFGYVKGDANYALLGTYTIVTEQEALNFVNPFNVEGRISGLKANLGASVRLNRFTFNLDYTFQGFNNLAFGLDYSLLRANE